jgi:phospholipid/cholesterol/gamma-HCH transport system permease protein
MQITETAEDSVLVVLSGDWTMARSRPAATEFLETLENRPQLRSVAFDTTLLSDWDSSFVSFLLQVLHLCRDHHISAQRDGLPEGALQLIALAGAVPEQKEARKTPIRLSFLSRVGTSVLDWREEARAMASFVGEAALAMVNLARGRARFRRADLGLLLQECGPQALPIVSLISVLVGLILAFVGAIQLRLFGAQIYVADLVGLGMAREMGAMMTAIIMAGRTGAAFAAQLGTMQVNEEIDALRTLGLSPIEFLVLRRSRSRGRDAGSVCCRVLPRNDTRGGTGRLPCRSFQECGVCGRGGLCRLSSRHAVRQKLFGSGRGDHLRGGDQHRPDCCDRCPAHRHLRHTRHLKPREASEP